jgi:hypothetical protein
MLKAPPNLGCSFCNYVVHFAIIFNKVAKSMCDGWSDSCFGLESPITQSQGNIEIFIKILLKRRSKSEIKLIS